MQLDANTPDGVYENDNGTKVQIATEIIGSFCMVTNMGHWKVCARKELPEAIAEVEDKVAKTVLEELKGEDIDEFS